MLLTGNTRQGCGHAFFWVAAIKEPIMTKVLYLTSSPSTGSYSTRIGERVIDELKQSHPGATVTTRDLARDPLPHIDADFLQATRSAEGPQNDTQRAMAVRSDALVRELFDADILVIAAPMYNFSIPSTLKAWIDHIARPGVTFSYSAKGPEGLVKGKRAIIINAKGGIYSSGPAQALEHQSTYLRGVLGFIGITDVEVIDVEGIGLGPDAAAKAVERGNECARALAVARAA
jgi:FMN-dependent NADH-azoreductase